MPENFVNRYQVALAAGVTSGAATGTVTSVTGIPAYPFRAIISAEGANTDEIVLVTLVAGTTVTWTRAAEAVAGVQAASAHGIGATFTAIVTAVGLLNSPGRLDIRSFGAVTTSADNAVAIQAALDYQKANGGIVYIPEGTFLTSPLTYAAPSSPGQALHIRGAGRDRAILKPKAGTGTVLTLSGAINQSSFRDFQIDGTGGTGHGLYYSGTAGPDWIYTSVFEDLDFRNCAQVGLYLKSSFSNRYVNINASGNGQDQIKVWGGPGDYYERIDIGSTVVSYSGIRALYGGTFVACNGIYDTATAAGSMLKFGGDGTGESDSRTTYPWVQVMGSNIEAFSVVGIQFVQTPTRAHLDGSSFLTAAGAANCKAIDMQGGIAGVPLVLSGCGFALGAGATWANSYPIHADLPVASDGEVTGNQVAAYSDTVTLPYPISQRVFGEASPNTSTYGWKSNVLYGYTDVAYMASMTLGNSKATNDNVQRTAADVMPTSGTYRRGDIVDNCSHSIAEAGGAGVKYTLTGWRRLTDGSAHVLNTDWVERRELTGN